MALRRAYVLNDTRTGNAVPNAYIRVAAVHVNERDQAVVTLHYWSTRAVYQSGQFIPFKVDATTYIMDPFDQSAGVNLKSQVYAFLKAQPEFLAAVDE